MLDNVLIIVQIKLCSNYSSVISLLGLDHIGLIEFEHFNYSRLGW